MTDETAPGPRPDDASAPAGGSPDGSAPAPEQPDTDGPVDVTPEQEAAVSAALRSLPDPVMPDDVAARLDTALRTAPPLPTASGGATVLPLDAARDRQARRQKWSGRGLGVAAGVAALLVVSGVVVSQLSNGSSGSSADLAAGAETATTPLAVVSSDTNYTEQKLPQQINAVLTSATSEATPLSVEPSPTSTQGSNDDTFKDLPQGSQQQLTQCVTGLTEGSDTSPLMADYAHFQRKPALIVAVPGRVIVGTVEVFVVDPTCTGGPDVRLFYYRVVKVAELPALSGVDLPSPTPSS